MGNPSASGGKMGDQSDNRLLDTSARSRPVSTRPPVANGNGTGNGHERGSGPRPTNHAAVSRRKRALDLTVVLVLFPALLPLFVVLALLVACTSKGPVIFFQERAGLHGRAFRMMKFRTMREDAEARLRADPALWDMYVDNDFKLPAESDPRITPIGRLLRRSSLDELPQLINVVRGQMSLVGPRPVTSEQLGTYAPDHREAYLSIKPGVTGPWQVNGRSGVSYPGRVALDRAYAADWSVRNDLKILVQTPWAVLSRRGAH